jgi:hypothetical protein
VKLLSTCTVAALLLFALCARGERLIGEGDLWRYYKGSSTPPAQGGLNWTQPGFSDATWGPASPSGFGYGDDDDATIFTDMVNSYASVFLRRTFTVADPAAITRLTLAVDYDDGFVAYLNGVEIARRNMPAGTITHSTFASSAREASRGEGGANPQEKEFIAINPALLVAGNNVLAISGHNASLNSSDFSLVPELYTNVTLIRGPILQMPSPGQISISWRTDALTDSVVEYGTDTTYSSGSISDPSLVRQHLVTLPQLPPNSTYYYRISSGGVVLAEASFQTPRTAEQPFRFSVYGDFGWSAAPGVVAHPPTAAVAARVNESGSHFTVTVGDNIYNDGQPGLYDPSWFVPYAPINRTAPLFPALGNHDVNNSTNGSYYLHNFYLPENGPAGQLERSYSFDYGSAHFAVVDTNPFAQNNTATMQAIRDWLAADLADTMQPWKFVVLHHPPFTSDGGVHGDNANVKAHLVPLFAQHGVQVVFQGHNHFYERLNAIDGVYYITTGAGGRSLYAPSNRKPYSARLVANEYSYTRIDMHGPRFDLTQINAAGAVIDQLHLDIAHPFRIDGLIDDTSWQRAQNGLRLYAAIRGNHLYVATQDAGEGSDHFIYVANVAGTMRPANWAKAGQVMQWSAFLADENDNAFQGWYDANSAQINNTAIARSMTSGLNNNPPANNGVLEGTLHLTSHFGSFPAQLHLAAAPYGTAEGGALVHQAQVPAGNGNGNIEPNEFLIINTRDLALDLPTSNAGAAQTAEAGMPVQLNGSGTSPSGLPLSFSWSQLSGPAVTITRANEQVAFFSLSFNVEELTTLTFQLRVNDTRFDTDSQVTVQLYPMVDSDGDGLSDQEELTGIDNVLTAANPGGHTTNPNNPDTDADGMSDGDEALAGTDPNSATSRFAAAAVALAGEVVTLSWSSVPGRVYQVQTKSDLAAGTWSDYGKPITAEEPVTTHEVPASGTRMFYRVRLLP